jgi:hypothetical protein
MRLSGAGSKTLLNAELQQQKDAGEEPTRVLSTPGG